MTIRHELRYLTLDVPNPVYDGRAKHDLRSVKTFKAGSKFVFNRWVEEYGVETVNLMSATFIGDMVTVERRAVVEALVENSEPVAAATWAEQLAVSGCTGSEFWANSKIAARLFETNRALALELLGEVLAMED